MIIDIDLNILDSVAKAAREIGDNVEKSSKSVRATSENINAAWKSDSSALFIKDVEDVSMYLSQISDELNNLSNVIRNYSSRMRQLERENSAMFNGGGGGHSW